MKTTTEIAAAILARAKAVAAKQGTTVRALVEDGLRQVLRMNVQLRFSFATRVRWQQRTHPEFQDSTWGKIRDVANVQE